MTLFGTDRTLEEQYRGTLWDLILGYFDRTYQAERKRQLRRRLENRLDVRLLSPEQIRDLGLQRHVETENAREARRTTAWR